MDRYALAWVVIALSLPLASVTSAEGEIVSSEEVAWTDAQVPGVSIAPLEGDPAAGPSHFYLKYAAGFVAPPHHHSPDHYVTTLTGNLVLTVDGVEHSLAPGSYFALTNAASHGARCEGTVDCVMFIDARGAWDVVLEAVAQ